MSKINLGIVGTSTIAIEHIKILKKNKNINLFGITSRSNKNSKNIKDKFNFNKVFDNYLDMVKDENIHALFIVVSANQSYKVIKNIIKYKKPFFSEKPAGISLAESKNLKNLFLRFKTPNMIGFNRRYYSNFLKGLRIINKNGGIRAISIEGHERYWLLNKKINKQVLKKWSFANNIHMIDLILFFVGKIDSFKVYKKSYDGKINNYVNCSFKSKSSIIGNYTSYWNSPGGWTIKIYGKKITLVFDPLEKGYLIDSKFNRKKIDFNKYDINYKPGYYLQIKDFVDMIKRNKKVHNLETSYNSMNICNKIYS